jgi:MoaA/NifB/PqqE/SkfB family radical SAM enzyme
MRHIVRREHATGDPQVVYTYRVPATHLYPAETTCYFARRSGPWPLIIASIRRRLGGEYDVAQGIKDAVLIRSGYSCNSSCRFCDQAELRRTESDREAVDVMAAVDAADVAGKTVVLAGGEIILRRELTDWIERARELGARRVVVQTNGRMLAYPKMVRRLKKAGCDVFAVALHGHRFELHDWLTRSEGSFEQTLKGLENLRAAQAVTIVNSIITRSNYRHMPELVQLASRYGVVAVRFVWPKREGDAEQEWAMLEPDPSMVARYARIASGVGEKLRVRVSFEGTRDKSPVEVDHVG